MKKKLLICFLLGLSGCASAVKQPSVGKILAYGDSLVYTINESGFVLYSKEEILNCTVTYENGLVLKNIPVPFPSVILADSVISEENDAFADFQMKIETKSGEEIKLKWIDGHTIVCGDISFLVDQLEFRSDLDWPQEARQAFLLGEDIPLSVVLPTAYKEAIFRFRIGGAEETTLQIKNEQVLSEFLAELKSMRIHAPDPRSVPSAKIAYDRIQIDEATLIITNSLDRTIIFQDYRNHAFDVNGERAMLEGDPILDFVVGLLEEELFYFTIETNGFQGRLYLTPIYFANDDFQLTTEIAKMKGCGDSYGGALEALIDDYASYGLTAYENGQALKSLPNDNEEHQIEFHDQDGNRYRYQYKKCQE